jgi:hypothetical protein
MAESSPFPLSKIEHQTKCRNLAFRLSHYSHQNQTRVKCDPSVMAMIIRVLVQQ